MASLDVPLARIFLAAKTESDTVEDKSISIREKKVPAHSQCGSAGEERRWSRFSESEGRVELIKSTVGNSVLGSI